MAVEITIEDNRKDILEALQHNIANGLNAIGSTAEGYAKENCPVDTGRLRNSITYATSDFHSPQNTNKHPDGPTDASPEDSAVNGTPPKNEVHIGTNVEYAAAVEFRDATHKTGKAHFLKDAISGHNKEYKALMEAALRG